MRHDERNATKAGGGGRILPTVTVVAGLLVFAAPSLADDLQTAENVLLYQRETGGWPKNYDRKQALTEAQRRDVLNDKSKNDSMIDNGATHTEVRLLADAFQKTRDERFKEVALRGIRYLLSGQYDNGGWPQRFPDPGGYARYITFNDNAMIGVMSLLRDIADGKQAFRFVPDEMREQCERAVQRGIACILAKGCCKMTCRGGSTDSSKNRRRSGWSPEQESEANR